MEKFKSLSKEPVDVVEGKILDRWLKDDLLQKCIDERKDAPYFVFYDGPATANGHPGLHHLVAKFLKDTICKYKSMQGYKVIRKVGWDTHGLPVELQVEKELGFTDKKDIEKYGIKEFNEKCRESVMRNEKTFTDLTNKMGQLIDIKHPYVTYKNDYIETEWWILKKFWEEGMFYEGSKILPYCPRCGTGLASHEVALGYQEDPVDTVIVPMKKSDEDVYFLVWTTTPWTLFANVGLCVNPDYDYSLVESKGYKFILASSLVKKVLGDDAKTLKTFKGSEMEYWEYDRLIDGPKLSKKAFFVTVDPYVTDEDGTGIVHMAGAFGEDDARVCRNYNLPYYNPVGDDGKFTEGPWRGMLVFDASNEVIKYLKENDKLFKKQRIVHNYPHCWRCNSPLIYYSKPSYYLEITKIKDKIVANNKTVNWYPAYVGEKRFGNWLENLKDWAISRSRYWGTPLPYWICSTCGHSEMIGSRKELVEKAIEKIDESIELHRPYVDDVHLKCPECGGTMTRCKDVIDCWFDSGSMPFAQYHYPFENNDIFETQFPADFICEGIDQTRGWFYSLIVISTFVKGVSPFKNVLVNDLLLDAEGKKMSKSRGNIVEPFTTMKEYGADTVRFYLPYVSPVWVPLKFDINGLKEVHSKFFNPLRNTYNFFTMYANIDNIDINECNIPVENREEIDRWLISKYNKLLKYVTDAYDEYDLNKVVRALTDFVSDELSNWYIRRNRDRFWGSELNDSKKSVYMTTYEVLVGLSKMMAPVVPFLSEEIYTNLTGEYSVHTSDFPKYNEVYIDELLEEKMDKVRDLISIGRYVREENKIRVRQPLEEILLDGKNELLIGNLTDLIKEELNVKKVTFIDDTSEYMNFTVKPNFKEVGKTLGKDLKEFQEKLLGLTVDDVNKLRKNEIVTIEISGKPLEVTSNMVDIRIDAKTGFNVGMENNEYVILNTNLTDELINEGIAREIVSKVQLMRKNINLELTDRITISYSASDKIKSAVDAFADYIKNETLASEITDNAKDGEEFSINDEKVLIAILKN